MTTLPSWHYGDPEVVAIRKEEEAASKERACGACINRVNFRWKGEDIIGCGFKKKTYGRRCEQFKRRREHHED